jgi:microcin C transport system permease protein
MTLSPLARRRLRNFRANRRGFTALWIFTSLFGLSLFAEVIANDRPLLVRYDGGFYVPVLKAYPETTFGGVFPTTTVYRDREVQRRRHESGNAPFELLIELGYLLGSLAELIQQPCVLVADQGGIRAELARYDARGDR